MPAPFAESPDSSCRSRREAQPLPHRAFKAAQAAQRAGDLGLEIQVLNRMQATRGKTGFDEYLISSWLAIAYVEQRDFTRVEPLLVAAARSPYAPADQRKGFMEAAIGILGTPARR